MSCALPHSPPVSGSPSCSSPSRGSVGLAGRSQSPPRSSSRWRCSTAPWFHTNDSTYQIEIAGDLVRDGTNPYGHDYRNSGMQRIYSRDGSVSPVALTNPALRHFPYLPGTAELATVWRLLPSPLDDVRFLVCLASLAMLAAAWAFPGPPWLRLVLGAVLAVNPLTLRAAWFGTADALSGPTGP